MGADLAWLAGPDGSVSRLSNCQEGLTKHQQTSGMRLKLRVDLGFPARQGWGSRPHLRRRWADADDRKNDGCGAPTVAFVAKANPQTGLGLIGHGGRRRHGSGGTIDIIDLGGR